MGTYRLTEKQKRSWRPRLIKQYGLVCFYCKAPFVIELHTLQGMQNPLAEEYDHLNDKEYDNRIENTVLSHKMCNSKKRFDPQMKQVAIDQLRENEIHGIKETNQSESTITPEEIEDNKNREYNEEIYANSEFAKITIEFLAKKLKDEKRIPYKTTIDSITYLCFDRLGHASQNSIRRTIDMLTSEEGRYYKFRDGGKQWISKDNPLFSK